MSLFRNAFAKMGRRFMSTTAEESAAGAGGLIVAVGTTFGTYMTADFLSNFIQHPTQKVSLVEDVFGKLFAQGILVLVSHPCLSTLDGLRIL